MTTVRGRFACARAIEQLETWRIWEGADHQQLREIEAVVEDTLKLLRLGEQFRVLKALFASS